MNKYMIVNVSEPEHSFIVDDETIGRSAIESLRDMFPFNLFLLFTDDNNIVLTTEEI